MDTYACIICGFHIYDDGSWLREYRIVYSDPTGSFVTGIGCYDDSASWTAPLDPALRWDSKKYEQTIISVMDQKPDAGQHGFVLHQACWCLLQKACEPDVIPLQRLIEMFESLPFPLCSNGAFWGHTYGNLWTLDTRKYYPWYEQFFTSPQDTDCFPDVQQNPFEVPELPAILSHSAMPPESKIPLGAPAKDLFSRLPWEIREDIAILLPTSDALNLRLACKSFLSIYESKVFWASRFDTESERGFLFETRQRKSARWLLGLFRLTGEDLCPRGLRNRRRIWDLIVQLAAIAKKPSIGSCTSSNHPYLLEKNWARLAGSELSKDLNCDWRRFYQGCRSTGAVVLPIPEGLVRIGITVIRFKNSSYITGVRFFAEGGANTMAGYVLDSHEAFYELRKLYGFYLAIGPGGVRAVRVFDQTGSSSWIGLADHVPVSQRLVSSKPVEAVEVRLDGFKVTGLAVSPQPRISTSIMQTALWYPSIPPEDLSLNEGSFTHRNLLYTSYRPLQWMHFGGRRGFHLNRITGVYAHYAHRLHGLEFAYDRSRKETPSGVLGFNTPLPKSSFFAIDGDKGERIELIEVSVEQSSCPTHGFLKSIKMTTNRGRAYNIGSPCKSGSTPLRIEKSTTITGFYANHDAESGLINFGVISEML